MLFDPSLQSFMSDETIFIRVSRALSDTPNGILHSWKQCSVGRTLIRHLPRFLLSFYSLSTFVFIRLCSLACCKSLSKFYELHLLLLLIYLFSLSFSLLSIFFCLLSICHYLLSFSLSVFSLVFIICHYYLTISFLSLN